MMTRKMEKKSENGRALKEEQHGYRENGQKKEKKKKKKKRRKKNMKRGRGKMEGKNN